MKYRTAAAAVTVHTENNRNEAHCNDEEDIFTLLHTQTKTNSKQTEIEGI